MTAPAKLLSATLAAALAAAAIGLAVPEVATATAPSAPGGDSMTFPTTVTAHSSAKSIAYGSSSQLHVSFASHGSPRASTAVTMTATDSAGKHVVSHLITSGSGALDVTVSPASTTTYKFDIAAAGTATRATAALQVKVSTVAVSASLKAARVQNKGRTAALVATVKHGSAPLAGATVRLLANGRLTGRTARTTSTGTATFPVTQSRTVAYAITVDQHGPFRGTTAGLIQVVDGQRLAASSTTVRPSAAALITGHSTRLVTTVRSGNRLLANTAVQLLAGAHVVAQGRTSPAGTVAFTVTPTATTTYSVISTPAAPAHAARFQAAADSADPSDPTAPSTGDTTVTVADPAPTNINFVTQQVAPAAPGDTTALTAVATSDGQPLADAPVTVVGLDELGAGEGPVAQATTDSSGQISLDVAPPVTNAYIATVAATDTTASTSTDTYVYVAQPVVHPTSVDMDTTEPGSLDFNSTLKVQLTDATVDTGSNPNGDGLPAATVWHGTIVSTVAQPTDLSQFIGTPVTINIPADQLLYMRQISGNTIQSSYNLFDAASLGKLIPGSSNYVPGSTLGIRGHFYGDTSGVTVDVENGGDDGYFSNGTPVLVGLLPSA